MSDPSNFTTTNSSRGPNAISRAGHWAFDDVPAPLCLIGFDGRFQRVNVAWSQLLGHRPQVLAGKSFARFVHPDDAQLLVRQLCDPNCEGSEAFEARFRCGDGRYKWFHCETKSIAEQKVFIIVAVDITGRKEAEEFAKRRGAVASLRTEIWARLAAVLRRNRSSVSGPTLSRGSSMFRKSRFGPAPRPAAVWSCMQELGQRLPAKVAPIWRL